MLKKIWKWYRIKELEFGISGLENLLCMSTNPYQEGNLIVKINSMKLSLYELKNG